MNINDDNARPRSPMGDRPYDWSAGPGLARATAADRDSARSRVRRLTALGAAGALVGSGALTAALVYGSGSTTTASRATGTTGSTSSTSSTASDDSDDDTTSSVTGTTTDSSSSSSGGSVTSSGGS